MAFSCCMAPSMAASSTAPLPLHSVSPLRLPGPSFHLPSSSTSRLVLRAQQPGHDTNVRLESAVEPPERLDVSSNCVHPVFRSAFVDHQKLNNDLKAKILFLSESNTCRSVFADAVLTSLIKEQGLQDVLECNSKGTRDYNLGEAPDRLVIEVAEDLGIQLRNHTAKLFDCARDVVEYDLIVVMDKFTASDAMKDVTIHEAVDKQNRYSWKVRRLGEFCLERKIEDIDDPLYGNTGGSEELEQVHLAVLDIQDSCKGLMKFLLEIQSNLQGKENLKQGIFRSMGARQATDWLVPPMLQRN